MKRYMRMDTTCKFIQLFENEWMKNYLNKLLKMVIKIQYFHNFYLKLVCMCQYSALKQNQNFN